ncbi:MAG: carbohydrate kinase family protein [Sulfolobales archaeon]
MDKRFDVAVVGDINIDLIVVVNTLPKRGEMTYSEKIEKHHGGVGGNIASALAKLGLKTILIGAVGEDPLGVEALRELRRNKVDVSCVKVIPRMPTGFIIVIVDRDGERTMIGSRGANSEIVIGDVEMKIIEDSRHLHISGYTLLNKDVTGVIKLLRHAVDSGVPTSMDLEGVINLAGDPEEILEELKGLLTLTMVNEYEAKILFREDVENALIKKMLEKLGSRIVVIKLGPRGCIVASSKEVYSIPVFNTKIVDTTGAGDVFNAGFIYGILRGLDLVKTAKLANFLGAYKCMKIGARHSPNITELIEMFPELGQRLS